MSKDTQDDILMIILMSLMTICIIAYSIISIFAIKKIDNLENELEFYQEESIREGQIIAVNDAVVYVIDTLKEKVIEIDIYPELIHTTIEVGDIAVYGVNYDYTDADLLGIIKKE